MGQTVYKPRHRRIATEHRTFDVARDRDQALHRTYAWESFSARYLAVNPECYACGARSQVTDHLEPSKGREDVFTREGNFIPLCISCHNTVTRKFDSTFVVGRDSAHPKVRWLNEMRTKNEILQDRKFKKPQYARYEP